MNTRRITTAIIAALIAAAPAFAETGTWTDAREKDKQKERAESRTEREADLYEDGTDALDDHDFERAVSRFKSVVRLRGEHADAALYWLADAQNKLGQKSDALATLLELQKGYPKSHWTEDGKALEVEIRQSSGQKVDPQDLTDEDVKLMAINGFLGSDPEKAIPILERIIGGKSSPRVKERALFVLSQANTPRSLEILGRVARENSNDELQEKAIRYLGIMGGEASRKVLGDVYAASTNNDVKESILKSYMIAGDRTRLLAVARTEKNEDLRAQAVRQLGIIGARVELGDLYATESSMEIKKSIIQAMFIGNNTEKLADIARNEHAPELRGAAIRNLGLMHGPKTGDLLVSIYETDQNTEVRHEVIKALFLQSNAKALVALARKEKDPGLKREIVSKLSLIRSEDATNYLMEILKE
jgi:HEAT repeat protein